tara:strand:+ start:420 stop:1001 length:582 start_codon:yes stop_codon:yes gene_type:complete
MRKLNLGSGQNKKAGFINIDKFGESNPDLIIDLEKTPWEFDDDTVDEILLNHVLEHLGRDVDVFFSIIQEIYRICCDEAVIQVNVPHPRHDNYLNDPTHVRIITPELMGLFSKKNCLRWKEIGAANSPLALYLDVDFEIINSSVTLDPRYLSAYEAGEISNEEIKTAMNRYNNVIAEYTMTLKAIKSKSISDQ